MRIHSGDKVLLKNAWKMKFSQDAYIGPYIMTEVPKYGTARARKNTTSQKYIICATSPHLKNRIDFH